MIRVVIFISVIAVILGVRLLLEIMKNGALEDALYIERRKRAMAEYVLAEAKFRETAIKTSINQGKVSQDVKEAVHYAMVHAHPDNGGKQEDFIRFRKCYEQINV